MKQLSTVEAGFLESLAQLRYLSSEQVQSLWFPDRGLEALKRRLRDLRAEGYLRSVRRQIGEKALAWRLGGRGFQQLRGLIGDQIDWYQEVKPQFIEHLLDTNRVWIALAGPNPSWGDLAFRWTGSHRARFEFVSMERNRRRTRYVMPDAVIEPRRAGPRVFLELDRGTESLRERAGQQTIASKLKAYRAALVLPRPGERQSAYVATFRDGRAPCVLFVLAKDKRGRRAESIAAVAQQVAPELDVSCLQLEDTEAIRRVVFAASDTAAPIPPKPRSAPAVPIVAAPHVDDREVLQAAASFYRAAVLELKAVGVSARNAPQLVELQREVRERLQNAPRNTNQLVGGLYRRFFRGALEVLEKRRPRGQWSPELLAAEEKIRPILKLDSRMRDKVIGGCHVAQ